MQIITIINNKNVEYIFIYCNLSNNINIVCSI